MRYWNKLKELDFLPIALKQQNSINFLGVLSLAEENDLNILLYSATFQLLAQNVNNFRFSKFGKRVIFNKMNQNCVRIYLRHVPFPVRNSINI